MKTDYELIDKWLEKHKPTEIAFRHFDELPFDVNGKLEVIPVSYEVWNKWFCDFARWDIGARSGTWADEYDEYLNDEFPKHKAHIQKRVDERCEEHEIFNQLCCLVDRCQNEDEFEENNEGFFSL